MASGDKDTLEKVIITILVIVGLSLIIFVIGGHF